MSNRIAMTYRELADRIDKLGVEQLDMPVTLEVEDDYGKCCYNVYGAVRIADTEHSEVESYCPLIPIQIGDWG